MNPFLLKKKPVAGVIISRRSPDEPKEEQASDSIEYCVQDLIDAVHMKDTQAALKAIRDIFEKLESEPHEEAEHIEPHSYDASKEE